MRRDGTGRERCAVLRLRYRRAVGGVLVASVLARRYIPRFVRDLPRGLREVCLGFAQNLVCCCLKFLLGRWAGLLFCYTKNMPYPHFLLCTLLHLDINLVVRHAAAGAAVAVAV